MQAGGRQGQQRVARLNIFPCEQFFAVDYTDDEACQIVLARRIKARHFRSFAADERAASFAAGAAHALDELLDHLRLEFTHRQIIEEEERLGALHQDVIDAVIDQVATNRGVHAHGHSHFQFRPDSIGAGDQHRLFPFFVVEGEQCAEVADAAKHAGSKRAAGVMPDALLGFIGDGDIYTGIGVFHNRRDPCSVFREGATQRWNEALRRRVRNRMPNQEPAEHQNRKM